MGSKIETQIDASNEEQIKLADPNENIKIHELALKLSIPRINIDGVENAIEANNNSIKRGQKIAALQIS